MSVLCLLRSLFKVPKNCGGEKNTMYQLERLLVKEVAKERVYQELEIIKYWVFVCVFLLFLLFFNGGPVV